MDIDELNTKLDMIDKVFLSQSTKVCTKAPNAPVTAAELNDVIKAAYWALDEQRKALTEYLKSVK